MIYIVDNILNYAIYLFISHFGFRLSPRKNKFFICASVSIMLSAGVFNAYFDINSPIVYMVWSVLSISLFFEDNLLHLIVLSFGLMYFTGIIDTFSVMLIQVVLIGGGIAGEVTLCNGIKVVIGRVHGKEFKKEFFQWRMWFDN